MLRLFPFTAIRPRPDLAADIACQPYDVVSRDEARAVIAQTPNSFMRVVRPDADLPDSVDPYDGEVYGRGRKNLDEMLAAGALVKDPAQRVYLYRQEADLPSAKGPGRSRHAQIGVVCCCHADDYDRDLIKKHEKTRKDKEDDRVRHLLTLSAHAEPVFLAHRPLPALDRLVAAASAGAPMYDFTASDGVRHTVWAVDDHRPMLDTLSSLPALYVADGHHRCAAASRAAAELRGRPGGEADRFLAVLFPSDQLRILPYHRVVVDMGALTPAAFLDRLATVCSIWPTTDPTPPAPGSFGLYLPRPIGWRRCEFLPESIPTYDPVNCLDVARLSDLVLGPILGIKDLRTDKRIDFVGGIRGHEELQRRVDEASSVKSTAAAFAMYPTSMEQLLAVADAGLMMPPKSTWFEPKLRSGLLIHSFG